jgi:hypothetical protein
MGRRAFGGSQTTKRVLPGVARLSACLFAAMGVSTPAAAQDNSAPLKFYEIETKYIFGFTEGSGIGLEGEKEFSIESNVSIGKRDGRYTASQTKLEYEFTPTQFIEFEFGALVSTHNIRNVTDLDNRSSVDLMGLVGEVRYLLIERTSNSPWSVTVSLEPNWRRIDETSGERVTNFELEGKINADVELIPKRLFGAVNFMYEPEWTRTGEGDVEHEATVGISGALAYRIVPQVVIGAEVWYLRHYDSFDLSQFTGDAVYVGPTLYVQLSRKMFMAAAWNTQIAGRDNENPGALNLTEFSRHRAKLKLAVEF